VYTVYVYLVLHTVIYSDYIIFECTFITLQCNSKTASCFVCEQCNSKTASCFVCDLENGKEKRGNGEGGMRGRGGCRLQGSVMDWHA
jgi:hypothetical protein